MSKTLVRRIIKRGMIVVELTDHDNPKDGVFVDDEMYWNT